MSVSYAHFTGVSTTCAREVASGPCWSSVPLRGRSRRPRRCASARSTRGCTRPPPLALGGPACMLACVNVVVDVVIWRAGRGARATAAIYHGMDALEPQRCVHCRTLKNPPFRKRSVFQLQICFPLTGVPPDSGRSPREGPLA